MDEDVPGTHKLCPPIKGFVCAEEASTATIWQPAAAVHVKHDENDVPWLVVCTG